MRGGEAPGPEHMWECKVLGYMKYMARFAGMMLTVALSLDRVIAVTKPILYRVHGTTRKAQIAVGVILLFAAVYALPIVLALDITYLDETFICSIKADLGPLWKVYTWVQILVNTVIPYLIIFTANWIIISSLHQRQKFLAEVDGTHSTGMCFISIILIRGAGAH